MAATLLPPALESVPVQKTLSDNNGNGIGGGRGHVDDPGNEPHDNSEPAPDRRTTPLSACRAGTLVGIVWILTLFATLTIVLEFLRIHSKHWVSIPIPHVLYLNTAILMLSSLSIEMARSSLRSHSIKGCVHWLFIALLFGLAFVGGQIAAWQWLILRGLHVTSDSASFFFFLIPAVHALHLLGGLVALSVVIFALSRLESSRQDHVGIIALYWHFMDGLWLCILAALVTIQR